MGPLFSFSSAFALLRTGGREGGSTGRRNIRRIRRWDCIRWVVTRKCHFRMFSTQAATTMVKLMGGLGGGGVTLRSILSVVRPLGIGILMQTQSRCLDLSLSGRSPRDKWIDARSFTVVKFATHRCHQRLARCTSFASDPDWGRRRGGGGFCELAIKSPNQDGENCLLSSRSTNHTQPPTSSHTL